MGIGERDSQPKRKISVGFIQPTELQGDTIYVQLRKKRDYIHADMISNVKLIYKNPYGHMEEGTFLPDHYVGRNNINEERNIDYFLERLEIQNNAGRSEDRRIKEGLILTQKLNRLEELVRILKDILPALEKSSTL